MEVALRLGLQVLLLAVLAVAAYTDLRWLLVPNWAVMPALARSPGAVILLPDWPGRLMAGLALGGLLFSLTFTGLGMGDVKLGGLLGLVLGFRAGARPFPGRPDLWPGWPGSTRGPPDTPSDPHAVRTVPRPRDCDHPGWAGDGAGLLVKLDGVIGRPALFCHKYTVHAFPRFKDGPRSEATAPLVPLTGETLKFDRYLFLDLCSAVHSLPLPVANGRSSRPDRSRTLTPHPSCTLRLQRRPCPVADVL